jgi:hypothetical protein
VIATRSPFSRTRSRVAWHAAQRIEDRAVELDPAVAGRDDAGRSGFQVGIVAKKQLSRHQSILKGTHPFTRNDATTLMDSSVKGCVPFI